MKFKLLKFFFFFVIFLVSGCSEIEINDEIIINESIYDVIIIGAGASGLSAAKILDEYNTSYIILEASSRYGGRMKKIENFSNFPIDLGAEWIHYDLDVFKEITRNETFDITPYTIVYNPQELYYVEYEELQDMSELADEYVEFKFKNITWFDFFEEYIITNNINNSIKFNSPVTFIDYNSNIIKIKTLENRTYYAQKVLVTVPISVLQKEYIEFSPKFSNQKMNAIHSFNFSPGFKAFLKFEEQFYPDLVEFENLKNSNSYEEKTFYDATFKKDTNDNVLGVLIVGNHYEKYRGMNENEIIEELLFELDELLDDSASLYFEKGIVQYWSKIKYIEGTYITNSDELYFKTQQIKKPIDNKIYFSGSAYSIQYQGTVTGAVLSAYDAVDNIVSE